MLYSDFEKLTEKTVILYVQHEDVMIEEHEVDVSEMRYFLKFGKIKQGRKDFSAWGFFLSDNTIFYGSGMFNVYFDFQECLNKCIENEIEYWEDEIEIDYKKALFRVLKNSYGI